MGVQENRAAMSRRKTRTVEWRIGAEGDGRQKEKSCPERTRAVGTVDVTAFGFALERGWLPKGKEKPVHMR